MKTRSRNKKLLSLLMSMLMILTSLPIVLAADDGIDLSNAVFFEFSDTSIEVKSGSSSGYKIKGTALTVNEEGTYVVSGSCSDGSIKVKKGTKNVVLVLNGLTLESSDTAPITCNKSSSVTVVAMSNTENTLTDSEKNNDETYTENENAENAVIKCKDGSQVTLCGLGKLTINANGKNGIKSGSTTESEGEAWLLIKDLTLTVNAKVNDAINAEQLLTVESGVLNITAADDAIHSDYVLNIGKDGESGPTIVINGCYEGLEGAEVNINSGNIKIQATDDCLNAANSDLTDYSFSLKIFDGTLYMYTESGDGIDSNGTLEISGGTVVVWTANTADNQPLDADGTISITGGTVFAAGGSSGMGMNLSCTIPYVIFGGQNSSGQPGKPGGFGGNSQTPPEKPDGEQAGSGENMFRSSENENALNEANRNPGFGTGGQVLLSNGSEISIKDSDGNEVYTDTARCNASYVFFASSALSNDGEYSLYNGSSKVADSTDGSSSGNSGSCSHICHSSNLVAKVIWKIILVILKAFNLNRYCSCGAVHW